MPITRQQLLAAAAESKNRPATKTIPLNYPPLLAGDVTVVAMSGAELSLFHESLYTGKGNKRKVVTTNIQAKMAARCIVESATSLERLFTDDDAALLGNLPAGLLTKIYDAIQEVSGIGGEDDDEVDAEKKAHSATTPSSTSLTASR